MDAKRLVFNEEEDEFGSGEFVSESRVGVDGSRDGRMDRLVDGEGDGDGNGHGNGNGDEEVAWACRYCGQSDPECVVRALESNSWFCNSTGDTSASHIVHHLVRAKENQICLHPNSPLGETIVECYNCSSRNIFLMGFIPAKGESVVVLLCRSCLALGGSLKEIGWNLDSWTPIVVDRSLVPWLVKASDCPNNITTAQINKLEDMWKKNPVAAIDDLEAPGAEEDDYEPVQLKYEDGFHYRAVFQPLVNLESEYDRELKGQMSEENVSLRWKVGDVSGRVTAMLTFNAGITESMRLNIGDELKLTLNRHLIGNMNANTNKDIIISANRKDAAMMQGGKVAATSNSASTSAARDWECSGTVIDVDEDGQLCIELRRKDNIPLHVENGFGVSFVWKPITFDRMQAALKTFANDDDSMSGYLYHKLLGHDIDEQTLEVSLPSRFNVKGLPDLNDSQTEAIRQVLRKPLALIQGPPGTGKTVTSASLVYHMVKQNKGAQILVTAPSNVAVDQLTAKIHQTGLRVVRITAKSREHLDSNVEHLALHYIVQNLGSTTSTQLQRLLKKKEDSGNQLSAGDMKQLNRIRKGLEHQILKAADVICCTCAGAGDPRLIGYKFRHVLLDEATQATEPESLIPIVMGCKQFVLVGDHCQLGPVVICKKAANAGLNSSMFERLVTLGLRPIRLTVQYRMHPCLSEFPSNTFYEGTLDNGVSENDRARRDVSFPWPRPDKPMMFYACMGAEELAGTGTTFLNRTEALTCERVVTALIKTGASPHQIGVVTPYEGQRAFIVGNMPRSGGLRGQQYKDVEVSSVDAFQGREKDYIILSCVRSNQKQGIGFLNDPRRLNVALTRAKYGLLILGNPHVLAQRPLWNALLVHFREKGVLVEGSLANLKVSDMKFPKVRKYYQDRRQRIFDESVAKVFSGDVNDPFGERRSGSNQAPLQDSRHDPRYGGATHARPPSYDPHNGAFMPRPTIAISESTLSTTWGYKGYGDFDYALPKDEPRNGDAKEEEEVLEAFGNNNLLHTQELAEPMTQLHPPSQSQFNMLTQLEQQSQTQTQYHFEDEDD